MEAKWVFTVWRGVAVGALLALSAGFARAQTASLRGRALTDSTERPIAGVVVSIPELQLQSTSDSLGNYLIPNVLLGEHNVVARKIGFAPTISRLLFTGGPYNADLILTPTAVQSLPEVTVEAKAVPHGKLVEFDERRTSHAGGRFLTQVDLEKHSYATLSDALRVLPGLEFRRNPALGNEVYAVAGRNSTPSCSLCKAGSGPPPPCLAAVVVDGAFVYHGEGPAFNVNAINPTDIAGLEYYAGASSMPIKYNSTRSTCGLLIIWTK